MRSNQLADGIERHRIMIVGSNVTTVQRVSCYCLEQGVEVFPYYGTPTEEEIALFAPQTVVLCLPVSEDFRRQIVQPYIFWSEQPVDIGEPLVCTRTELEARLQELLHA